MENVWTGVEKMNFAASLNNLALTDIRLRKMRTAIRHWRSALELVGPAPEIVQNVGRMKHLARDSTKARSGRRDLLYFDRGEKDALESLCSKVGAALKGFDKSRGWRYMRFIPENSDGVEEQAQDGNRQQPDGGVGGQDANLIRVASGTGFVVAPGYILTNCHVVEDTDALRVVFDGPEDRQRTATIVSLSDKDDLALLRCKTLGAPPLPFATAPPRLALEVHLLGYPTPDLLGRTLKVTGGIITGLPPHRGMVFTEYRDCLLYDAVIHGGNSGGPACNKVGQVVAVNKAVIEPETIGGGYAVGIPAERALAFLGQALPGYTNPPRPKRQMSDWPDAVEFVRQSTVQVICMAQRERFVPGVANLGEFKWDPYEDPWCMACYGQNMLDCPTRGCARGKVRSIRMEKFNYPDGTFVLSEVPIRAECGTCSGKGHISCKFCKYGLEDAFINAARIAWLKKYIKTLILLDKLGLLD